MDLKNMSFDEKYNLTLDTNTPKDILRELAKDDDEAIRSEVVYNLNIPDDALLQLTKDKYPFIRCRVAYNLNSSSKILVSQFEYEKSLREPSANVIRALYQNNKLPYVAKVIIETLFRNWLS